MQSAVNAGSSELHVTTANAFERSECAFQGARAYTPTSIGPRLIKRTAMISDRALPSHAGLRLALLVQIYGLDKFQKLFHSF